MRTFVFTDAKSNKFWHIDLHGDRFTVTFGKLGSKGQTQLKEFPDAAAARKAHDKLVAEKLAKGYVETTPAPAAAIAPPPAAPLQRSLEAALAEDPDDLAAHSAYADYLAEQGDPRGEFIQVQLALEDAGRSAGERKQLRTREAALLSQHARRWLGDVGRFLVGDWSGEDKPYHYQFRRGWLDRLRTLPFPEAVVAALARSPEARLLRRLEVVYDMAYHPFDFDQWVEGPNAALKEGEEPSDLDGAVWTEDVDILSPLLESPHLGNLRVFKFGFSDSGEQPAHSTMVNLFEHYTAGQVIGLLGKCPRLAELYLNTHLAGVEQLFALPSLNNLRLLQYYYGMDQHTRNRTPQGAYPLARLANNPSLRNLTTLRLHPGREAMIGLDDFDAVLRSPHLPALTHLQVHTTNFGDEGARRLIESGALRRLKALDIGYGALTDDGARLLAACADLKHLDRLDVSRNGLTPSGIAALRATGVEVVADDQHDPDEEISLFEVDFE
jgi:uncharacterized protein (TIGR02996 family)